MKVMWNKHLENDFPRIITKAIVTKFAMANHFNNNLVYEQFKYKLNYVWNLNKGLNNW